MKRKSLLVFIPLIITVVIITVIKIKKSSNSNIAITVTYPKDIQNLDIMSNILLDDFSIKKNIPHHFNVDDSSVYLDELKNKLKEPEQGDIFYVVNNRTVNSPDITNPAYDFEITDRSFKKIPDSLKSISEVNKTFTYVPFTWAPWGIYYNKRIFKTLGFEEPESFYQLEEICVKLIQNDIIPFSMMQNLKWPLTSWFDYISIRKYGAGFHNNLLAGRIDFTSDEVQTIFLTLYEIINKGWLYTTESGEWSIMTDTLTDGRTAMALSSTFFYTNIPETERENIGWFPFPGMNSEYNDEIITSAGFLVSNTTDNIDGVKEFCEYIASEGQKIINNYTVFNPIDEKLIRRSDREDLLEGFRNVARSSKVIPSFERNNHPLLLNPLKYSINRLFYLTSDDEILKILEELEIIRIEIR